MGRQLRENTKKKTAISARKAQDASKTKRTAQRITKQEMWEKAVQQNLVLSSITSTDPKDLRENEKHWLTQNLSTANNPFGYVPSRLAKLLHTKRRGAKNLYLWLQNEVDHQVRPFPILMVAQGNFPPTIRIATTSIQNGEEEFHLFEQAGLAWEALQLQECIPNDKNNKIFVLKMEDEQLFHQLFYQLCPEKEEHDENWVMPVLTRGAVENEQPKVVGIISIEYNNVKLDWDHQNDKNFHEVFADYEADMDVELSEATKTEIQHLLTEEKQHLEAEAHSKVERNKQDFSTMVNQMAAQHQSTREDILNHLDHHLQLYKLYPTGLPEPQPTAFGPSGGVVKTNLINRFCSATQYFVS